MQTRPRFACASVLASLSSAALACSEAAPVDPDHTEQLLYAVGTDGVEKAFETQGEIAGIGRIR